MKFRLLAAFLGLSALPAVAQEAPTRSTDFDGEIGLLSFENQEGERERYFSAVLLPTFSRGPWAVGARIKMRVNQGGFRKEDYNSVADFLSIARFVQYGEHPETERRSLPVHGRFGEVEGTTLGYGQLINEYRNTISVDNPRIGLEGSRGTTDAFMQGLFGSLTDPAVFGLRGAYWPFQNREGFRFREAVFGATLAGDLKEDGRYVNPDSPGTAFVAENEVGNPLIGVVPGESDGALLIASVDAGLPIQVANFDEMLVYTEFAKILGHGSGLSLGLNGTRRRGGVLMEGWFEQRLIGKRYLPGYFNSLYEVERVQQRTVDFGDGTTIPAIQSKRNLLAGQDKVLFGSFVAASARMGRRYRFRTSFDRIWNQPASDWFHIDVRIDDPNLPYQIRFMFDRINMDRIEDIWNGPAENGIVRLELAYAFWEKLLLGFRFRQTFEPVERLGRLVGQDKQTRIEPNVVIRL